MWELPSPPRSDAVLSDTAGTAPTQRDRHIQMIAETGRRSGKTRPLSAAWVTE